MLESEALNKASDLLEAGVWVHGGRPAGNNNGTGCALDFLADVQGRKGGWHDADAPQRLCQVCADWCAENVPESCRASWKFMGDRDWVVVANDWATASTFMTKEKMVSLFRLAADLAKVDELTGVKFHMSAPPHGQALADTLGVETKKYLGDPVFISMDECTITVSQTYVSFGLTNLVELNVKMDAVDTGKIHIGPYLTIEPPTPQFIDEVDAAQDAERIETDPMIREVHDEDDDDCLVQERSVATVT